MRTYRCEYCGNAFDPVKSGVCPSCGAAVSPAVMTEIEREQSAARKRAQRMKEDILRRHEAQDQPGPTRLSSARQSAAPRPRRTPRADRSFTLLFGMVWVFVLVVIIIVFAVFMAFRSRMDRLLEEPVQSGGIKLPEGPVLILTEPQTEPTVTEQVGGLGDTLSTSEYAVTALSVQDYEAKGYETMNLEEGYRIVAVELRVKNLSHENYRMEEVWGWAEDAEGWYLDVEEHAPNDEQRPRSLYTGSLYPGHETTGLVFLEVPEEAEALWLYYGYEDLKFRIPLS